MSAAPAAKPAQLPPMSPLFREAVIALAKAAAARELQRRREIQQP